MEPLENTTEEDKLTLFVEWLLANRLQVGLGVVIALGIGAYLTLQKTEALAMEEFLCLVLYKGSGFLEFLEP